MTNIVFSQSELESFKKYTLGVSFGVHHAFDGNPVYQSKQFHDSIDFDFPVASSFFYDIAYSKCYKKNAQWGFSLSGTTFRKVNAISEYYRGRILDRSFIDVRFLHGLVIFDKSKHNLEVLNELSVRYGNESFLASWGTIGYSGSTPIYETLPLSRVLADVGTGIGLRYNYSLFKGFSLHAELNYTFYALTFYNKHYRYSYDKGTTRNLLVFNIGLSYHFGDIENKKSDIGRIKQTEKLRKNNFFVQRKIYHFFQNEPSIQKRNDDLGFGPNLSQSFGFGYQRKLKDNSYISLSIDDYEFRNTTLDTELLNGSTKGRTFLGSQISYLRSIKGFENSAFFGSLGIYYRHGLEYIVGDKLTTDHNNTWSKKQLRDLGISAGFKFHQYVNRHINIQSSLNYTYLVYTHDEPNPKYAWDRNPTKNMISFSVGLGFNYGE